MRLWDISFREGSAWIMAGACLLSGIVYFGITAAIFRDTGQLVPPIVPFIVAVIVLTIAAIVGNVLAALLDPRSANAAEDERDRWIALKASHVSGLILGFGLIISLLLNLLAVDNARLFHMIFASLLVSQITEYGLCIIGYRKLSSQGDA